jgi:hypothetical protein
MTDPSEDPIDLTPLARDAALRASRVAARVAARVRAERDGWGGVRTRLARVALPVSLAAAASLAAIALSARRKARDPERFAVVVLGAGPAARWVATDRRPEISELMALVAPTP